MTVQRRRWLILVGVLASLCCALLAAAAHADGGNIAEVRITARVGDEGRTEFALQSRSADGNWSQRILPRQRNFPVNATVGRWLYSSPVTVPSGTTSDLAVRVINGGFVVRADGLEYADPCGLLWLRRQTRHISIAVEDVPDCSELTSPVAVLPVPSAALEVDPKDPQQHLVYDWESNLGISVLPGYLQERITTAEAVEIARAVYSDHFRGRIAAPRVRVVRPEALGGFDGVYRTGAHVIELTPGGMTADVMLHELTHAIVNSAGLVDVSHGSDFPAQRLALWERYIPNFDAAAARRAANDYGIRVAVRAPVRSTGGAAELAAVMDAIGVPTGGELSDAPIPGPRGIPRLDGEIVVRVAARLLASGQIEFAVQPRGAEGAWSGRIHPSRRFLPADPPTNRWLSSTPTFVASGSAVIPARVADDAVSFEAEGVALSDPCGSALLFRGLRAVWLGTLDGATCSVLGDIVPILFADDITSEPEQADSQLNQYSDWILQLRFNDSLPDILDVEISLTDAHALAEAIFTDYFNNRVMSPIRFTQNSDGIHAEYSAHGWRVRWDWGPHLDIERVLHVVLKALLDIDGGEAYIMQRADYDPRFIGQLLSVLERYLPEFDTEAARRAARVHSLHFSPRTPVPATGSAFNRAVIRTLISGQ